MTVKFRISQAVEKCRTGGAQPKEVHLTKADAVALQYELIAEGGDVARAIVRDGLNKAVREVQGLHVVWRSSSFQVV
jgi:hypothetical protein